MIVDQNFKTEMLNSFIPRVESMLAKEEAHLAHLIEMQQKMKKWYHNILWPNALQKIEIEHMIDYSQQMVDHIKKRLTEYKAYIA